ncbi:hypothetical protein HZ326_27389 [Fusarium oxysporum f. sp. albedinis]|nr:hypothetical protein HZ326_27389 [Fusarium oxysporum f. sp. albedinis]
MAASDGGHAEVVTLLLGAPHIDASKPDDLGRTALFFASKFGRYQAARVLLSDGRVNPNVRDCVGPTALFAAVANVHLHVAKLLVTSGAAVEMQGSVGRLGTWISDDHIPNDLVSTPFDHEAPWCDACTLNIQGGCRYSCSVCDGGSACAWRAMLGVFDYATRVMLLCFNECSRGVSGSYRNLRPPLLPCSSKSTFLVHSFELISTLFIPLPFCTCDEC